MEPQVVVGEYIRDIDFEYNDYSLFHYGLESNLPQYRVIKTLIKDYDSESGKRARMELMKNYKKCRYVDDFRNETDIYNYLTNSDNILISILQNNTYYIYCLNRQKMSERVMNDERFRDVFMGKSYIKFLPKIWTDEASFQSLLHSDLSVYVFEVVDDIDIMMGNVDGPDEISLGQRKTYGKAVRMLKAWDLLQLGRVLLNNSFI